MSINSINTVSQILVNFTVIISFVLGWTIYFIKYRKKRKKISKLKRKLKTLNNILPSDKSIDDLLAKTQKEDGSKVQLIISTNDGKVIDSSNESIDNYIRLIKETTENTINEVMSSLDNIATP